MKSQDIKSSYREVFSPLHYFSNNKLQITQNWWHFCLTNKDMLLLIHVEREESYSFWMKERTRSVCTEKSCVSKNSCSHYNIKAIQLAKSRLHQTMCTKKKKKGDLTFMNGRWRLGNESMKLSFRRSDTWKMAKHIVVSIHALGWKSFEWKENKPYHCWIAHLL